MLKEEIALVRTIAYEIAKEVVQEEIAKIPAPKTVTPKPVEVDIDGIVNLVLDKIQPVPAETPFPIKKGK